MCVTLGQVSPLKLGVEDIAGLKKRKRPFAMKLIHHCLCEFCFFSLQFYCLDLIGEITKGTNWCCLCWVSPNTAYKVSRASLNAIYIDLFKDLYLEWFSFYYLELYNSLYCSVLTKLF